MGKFLTSYLDFCFFSFLFFSFLGCAYRGLNPCPWRWKCSLNHWTAWEVPGFPFLFESFSKNYSFLQSIYSIYFFKILIKNFLLLLVLCLFDLINPAQVFKVTNFLLLFPFQVSWVNFFIITHRQSDFISKSCQDFILFSIFSQMK